MPVGLELRNQNGNALIDSTYRNFQLRERLSISAQQVFTREYWQISNPIPAVMFYDYGALEMGNTTARWTWYFASNGGAMCYLFDTEPPPPSDQNAGFEVFDESGRRCFSSVLGNFKVVDFVTVDTSILDTDFTFSYTVGRNYAVVPVSTSFYSMWFAPQQFWRLMRCTYKSINGAVVFRTMQIGIENDPAQYSTDGPVVRYARFLIVDVTGI